MSKDQSAEYLRYGQGILISGFATGGEDQGFLTAKGFADTMAIYQTYKQNLYFKNYRNAIFQIVPAANFELNDQLRRLRQIYAEDNANMKILAARSDSEAEQFDLQKKVKKGKEVCFGDLVIFKHADSDTYLSGTIEPSGGTNGAFLVEVTKELKEILIFKVLPYRSYENIGMPIPFDSPVQLQNMYNNGFLTYEKIGISAKQKKFDLEKKPIETDDSYVIPVKTKSSQSDIFECVTHFMDLSKEPQSQHAVPTPMPWRFQLHIRDIDVTQSLIQHDIIYFQHTQNNGILSTKGMDIILKEMKEQGGGEELPFYECLWEVQKHDVSDDAYILRHLMSGMTLGIKKDPEGKPIKAMLFDISEGTAENNLGYVDIRLAKKEIADIDSGSYINICDGDWCLDKTKSEEAVEGEYQEQKSDDFVSIPKLNKLAVNQLEYEVQKVAFTTQISKNCFMIKQIEDDLKKQCLFALSFHAKIIELREDLKWGWQDSQQNIKYRRLMQVTQKIKEIKDFLKNCSKQQSDLEYIKPIFKRQMICKDLGISQLLFELLSYMKKNFMNKYEKVNEGEEGPGYIFHKDPNSWGKFWQLYNVIYEVIFELVRDNILFKIYVSKWINFVIQDVLIENEPSHLNLLKQLFKNNEFLVKNFVDAILIEKFASKMLRKSHYKFYQIKYLEIFRLFCIVKGTVNTGNQIILLQKFIKALKKTPESEMYQITISKQTNQEGKKEIFTDAAIDKNQIKPRRFNDYKKICKEEYQTAWWYFVEYINLIADMTKGRNKLVEDYVKGMFSIDILTDLFLNQSLEEAQPSIVRLLHNLYIESDPYYAIEKNKRISDYNLLKDEKIDVMNAVKTQPWKAQSLMKILNGVLKKLKKNYGPIDPKEVLKNECLYQYLAFIWQTLDLGFWETKEHVKKILAEILRILEPHPSVSEDYSKSSIGSKENSLMMDCKLECMNIIQLILDYDLDLSIRSTCQYFQTFEMPQLKRSLKASDSNLLQQKTDDLPAKNFIQQLPQNEDMNLVELSIIQKMIELSRYNNPKLTSGSISIIERVLLKRKKSIEGFTKQLFVCDTRLDLKTRIQEHKQKFYIMQDQSIVKILTEADQTENYVAVYKEDMNPAGAGIMQVINMMSQIIKHEVQISDFKQHLSLQNGNYINILGEDTLLNFTDQRNSSDYIKQSVLDAENIHLKVLQYIMNCQEIPPDGSFSKKLLHLSYKFLVSLIWNNQHIKPTLISYLPSLQHHLRKNVGCIDFLKEMYDNNKTLLFNQNNIRKLIKQICNAINAQPETSYYKSKLLDFFRFLIYCNGKSLKNNQILILKIMQDDSYTNILLNVDSNMIQELARQFYQPYNNIINEPQGKKIHVSPKLTYLITYFQIMQSLIDDKCSVNMGKLKKGYPFEKLLQWLRKADQCWPLKRNIRCMINRIYYFEPEIQVYMKEIVDKELDNIINDLNEYITLKTKSPETIIEIEKLKFENPIRFTYMESYLYLHLEENLFTLFMLATDKKIGEEMKTVLHPLDAGQTIGPINFIRICQRLGFIKNFFTQKKNTFTNSFIKFLLSRFEKVISEFDDEIFMPGMELPSGQKRAPMKSEKEEARKGLIAKIMRGDIGSFFAQGNPDCIKLKPLVYGVPNKAGNPKDDRQPNKKKLLNRLRQILRRPRKKQFNTEDQAVDFKLGRLVKAIKLSQEGQKLLSQDYNQKLKASAQWYSIKQYIKIIIQMNNKDRQALPVKAKKFFLNLITGTIDQGNLKQDRPFKTLDKWQAEDWIDSQSNINSLQNQLKLCKLGSFISQLLKQNIWQNVEFADSILLCGIAYMFGGFSNTQKDMIDILKIDKENRVMRNLQTLISKLGEFIVKNIEESSKKDEGDKDMFSITTIDNYDFYDVDTKYVWRKNVFQPETTDQQIYKNTCIRAYQRSFKFLQLLCENNNTDGKNFIRDQKNELKNFDFIKIAAKEIRNIFLFLTPEISEVSLFLLDFILEVTQIPVKLNQDALLNLTFFEDLCALHNTFYKKPDVVSVKGFQGKQSELDAIFEKGILIILSCFQGNEDKTFRAIDNKLEPKFLTNILTQKLEKMGLDTKQKAIQYIDQWKEYQFQDSMKAVLNILIIFQKLRQKIGVESSRVYSIYNNQRNKNLPLYQYLEKNLLRIQVIMGGTDQIVIFPKYPVFKSLTGGLRDTVMNSVDRSTHRAKIVSLQGYSSAIKSKMQSSYKLQKQEKITEKHMNDAFRISAFMSIAICIFMMMYYDVIINYQEADFQAPRTTGLIRFAISLIQLSMALVYAYYWLKFKIWENPQRKARVQTKKPIPQSDGQQQQSFIVKTWTKIDDFFQKKGINKKITQFHEIFKGGKTTQPLYLSAQFWRVAIYVIVSFIGAFFHPPLYFIHIMDIFCYNPEIGNIFKAIGLKISQLVYVSFMGVVFTFVFCTVTFSNYMKNVFTGDQAEEDRCQTMLDCILQLYVSGAIGQTMQSFEITRFTYDTIYGIFFGTMLSNIISGIMLNAFDSLRAQTSDLQRDKQNLCYICNIERKTIEEQKGSFHTHINGAHHLWNYVFYVYYLDSKSPTDYSGLEYQITSQYNQSDEDMQIDWVPVAVSEEFDSAGKLQELNQLVDDKNTQLEEKKAEIEEQLKNLKTILGE